MRKINEIFYSLQGEGHLAGCPAIFVRFCGCNMHCDFCDTDHRSGVEMTDEEIFDAVRAYPAEWVVLTGGEPSLWIDEEFVEQLKLTTGKSVAIETNGSVSLPGNIDWVTLSPKTGMPGAGDYRIEVRSADEIKVVEIGQDLEGYFSLPCRTEDTIMYLQPCHVEDGHINRLNMARTVDRVLSDPRWRLSVQLHRFLGIR